MHPFRHVFRGIIFLCIPLLFSCAGPSLTPSRQVVMKEAIKSYLGTPYQFGGTSYDGMDCSGLVMRVFQRVGIELPRSTREQIKMGERVPFGGLRFGDAVFFTSPSSADKGKFLHVGIYLGDDRFVHASKGNGVVIDVFSKNYWQRLFLEGRRYF